jgi:hypothetical protein
MAVAPALTITSAHVASVKLLTMIPVFGIRR